MATSQIYRLHTRRTGTPGCLALSVLKPSPYNGKSGWFQPTPLKNDGVKVSWDDDIPN